MAFGKTVSHCLKGKFCSDHDRFLLVAAADDLEEQVGRVRVIGEVADLIDREEAGPEVAAEPVLE